MNDAILIVQIIISVLLVAAVLLQSRGSGLGMTFGGGGENFRSKRGVEKLLYRATMVLAALFLIVSIVNVLIK